MKKTISSLIGLATMSFGPNHVWSQDYDSQIEALQNELLKLRQEMSSNKSDKSKAYFKKGKGLSIKSTDGKYSFQIKGRIMYDIAALLNAEKTVSGVTSDFSEGLAASGGGGFGTDGMGSEFRRIRFTMKGDVGNGWGFALQPDFAEIHADNRASAGQIVFKDAFISKKIKGLGKIMVGNVKAAAGMYENTSSNALVFMERPMVNELANLGHRTGLHYDSSGAFNKVLPIHLRASTFFGMEAAYRQDLSLDNPGGEQGESFGASIAAHYTAIDKKKTKAMIGAHFGYQDVSGESEDGSDFVRHDTNSARANGVHVFDDKAIDLGDVDNLSTYKFYGPQLLYIQGPLYLAGEYQVIEYTRQADTGGAKYEDINGHGWSIGAAYTLTGEMIKYSAKKGKIGGLKCKTHCTQVKAQYEYADLLDHSNTEGPGGGSGNSDTASNDGGQGSVWTIGASHYFNSDVRLMLEYSHGDFSFDDSVGGESEIDALQARLHLKF